MLPCALPGKLDNVVVERRSIALAAGEKVKAEIKEQSRDTSIFFIEILHWRGLHKVQEAPAQVVIAWPESRLQRAANLVVAIDVGQYPAQVTDCQGEQFCRADPTASPLHRYRGYPPFMTVGAAFSEARR
jgi:hypothetical protein